MTLCKPPLTFLCLNKTKGPCGPVLVQHLPSVICLAGFPRPSSWSLCTSQIKGPLTPGVHSGEFLALTSDFSFQLGGGEKVRSLLATSIQVEHRGVMRNNNKWELGRFGNESHVFKCQTKLMGNMCSFCQRNVLNPSILPLAEAGVSASLHTSVHSGTG